MAKVEVPDDRLNALLEDHRRRNWPRTAEEIVSDLMWHQLARIAEGDYGFDGLTGLKTRYRLRRDLQQAVRSERGNGSPEYRQTWLCIDVHRFKAFLDVEGLTAGDVVLRDVAEGLQRHYGVDDVYRAGGDEFVVALNAREPWLPPTRPEVHLQHCVLDVRVHRMDYWKDTNDEWVFQHICGALLMAHPEGTALDCRTPPWVP